MSRDWVHFMISGLFPKVVSIHFWITGIFSSIFLATLTRVAPSSGTTTSITMISTQTRKQMESTRLTGLASFMAAFFCCFTALPKRCFSINFIGTFRIKAIPHPRINGKRKPRSTLAVPITISRCWTPRYKSTAKAMR